MGMNPEVKAEWLKALRSGEYKQGAGVLMRYADEEQREPRYCCLGVLCDMAVKAGVAELIEDAGANQRPAAYGDTEDHSSSTYLPIAVQNWAGLEYNPGFDTPGGGYERLSDLNDRGSSFTEIADVIEKYL